MVLPPIFLLTTSLWSMNEAIEDTSRKTVNNPLFDNHLIRSHIPGNPHVLSENFKKFLSTISFHTALPHKEIITHAIFSPDSSYILTSSVDCIAYIWDAITGNLLHSFDHIMRINSISCSPDSKKAVIITDYCVKVWDILSGELIHTLQHEESVNQAAFSPCETKILTRSGLSTVNLWNALTGSIIHTLHHSYDIFSADFSPDGTKILTTGYMKPVKVWDVVKGTLLHTFMNNSHIKTIFSPEGSQLLATPNDHTAQLCDSNTGTVVQSFQHPSALRSVAFSPDGKLLINLDEAAYMWDTKSGNRIHRFTHKNFTGSGILSHDGSQMLTLSTRSRQWMSLYDTTTGELIYSFAEVDGFDLLALFSPDDMLILTSGRHDNITSTYKLRDAKTGDVIHQFTKIRTDMRKFLFSPDSSQILNARGTFLELLAVPKADEVDQLLRLANMNQIDLLQAFELAIREKSRIHIYNNNKGTEIMETFKSFPLSVQRKLRRFIVQEEKPKPQQSSYCSSSTQNNAENTHENSN